MPLAPVYDALADPTRRRILHLLTRSPLCVCHLQHILGEPQVKISKHLAYLRRRRLVVAVRRGKWMVYELPPRPNRPLQANLQCLRDCASADRTFRRDLVRLDRLAQTGAAVLTCTG